MTHGNYKSIKYYINKTLRLLTSIHYDDKIRRRMLSALDRCRHKNVFRKKRYIASKALDSRQLLRASYRRSPNLPAAEIAALVR